MRSGSDPLVLGSRTDSERDRYRFHTADGVASADSFCPGELLVLEHLWESPLGRLRIIDARYGVVGCVLAERAASVELLASSARAGALCERNVETNAVDASVDVATGLASVDGAASTGVSVDLVTGRSRSRTDGGGRPDERRIASIDTAVFVPRAYDPLELGIRRIESALDALSPDGDCFVAATPETGLRRFESALADVAASVSTVATRDDWALLHASAPDHVERATDPPFDWIRARINGTADDSAPVRGTDLSLVTAPGLFAPTELDAGTRLLAETATIEDGGSVLDLCCGYGPLGAYAGSVADCEVWCTDDDPLATACARRSLDANGVDGRVVTADALAGVGDRTFDTVLCNPPTHAGDGVLAELVQGVDGALAPGGRFWFVHHRSLDLTPHTNRFHRVETAATGDEHVVRLVRR